MTKAEYFTIAAKKNALRKEAGLPLIDMREEIQRQEYADAIAHYHRGTELYKADRNRIHREVLAEEQASRNSDMGSSGGRFIVARIAAERFKNFLAERGYAFPKSSGKVIRYGEK